MEYRPLIERFNPEAFDADLIIGRADAAGMEYVCLTAKPHDGFCLWDSDWTGYNVLKSPYGKDILKELADASHRRDFGLGLYSSVRSMSRSIRIRR